MELIITAIREETSQVKTFQLVPADGSGFSYRAGQFLTLAFRQGSREFRRSYSFSSAQGVDMQASITVKRVENGLFSRRLIDQAQIGDRLQAIDGATGLFTLPDATGDFAAVWLFAAGIGITPLYSLLKELLFNTAIPKVVLAYSNAGEKHAVFLAELERLKADLKDRFQLVHFLSDNRDLLRARMTRESFEVLRKEVLVQDPKHVLAFLCGPASYMWLLQLLLQDAHVPPSNVRRETFVVNKEVPKHAPVDKSPHVVTITAGSVKQQFVTEYPESILHSAKRAGIRLPYSCDAGQCGSCMAVCTTGRVWMSYNEVLTERDLANGRVLTCTGYAVDGDVALVYPA